jgi:hypothetical protein
MKNIMKRNIAFLSMAMLLGACDGGTREPHIDETPKNIYGTVKNISANSITVNGFLLEAGTAAVSYGNRPLQLSTVQQGMRVEVGTNKRGIAENIELAPNLLGEVSHVTSKSITVNDAVLLTSNASDFIVGEWAFVNAYLSESGQWIASGIFNIEPFPQAEIEGVITQYDNVNQQFYIGNTLVNYTDAVIEHDDSLINGAWADVEGSFSKGVFHAVEVEIDNEIQFESIDLEGVISWVNHEKTSMELNGRTRITLTSSTKYEDGSQADITEGKIVDVDIAKGKSSLVATEVEFKGSLANIPSALLPKFELEGEAFTAKKKDNFTLKGYDFSVDARTEFEDDLTIDSIINKQITVEGVKRLVNGQSQFLVKEIELVKSHDLEISLQGIVKNGEIWGYGATDKSLNTFNGRYVDLKCMRDGVAVKQCRIDE